MTEEHGRTNDELAAANAELVSGNEELQSMNEELETAKEELQSTNEELTTVNDELHSRNQEMNVLNNDLINLLGTVDVPILILDPDLRIRRFTPKSRSILNILPSDVGRPIGDIKPNIDVPDLEQQVAEVIREVKLKESEVQDREGRWYRMQIRPTWLPTSASTAPSFPWWTSTRSNTMSRGPGGPRRVGARQPGQGSIPGHAVARASHAAVHDADPRPAPVGGRRRGRPGESDRAKPSNGAPGCRFS